MSEQPGVYWGQVVKRFASDALSWPLHDKYKEAADALSSAAPLPPIPEEDPDAANGSYENGRRNRANTIEKLDSCRDASSFHGAPILDPQDYERLGKGAEKLANKTTAVVRLVDDLYGLKGLPAEERAEGLTSAFASIACKASSIKEMELAEKIAENTQQGGYCFVDTERENRADMPLHIKKRLERVRGLNKICKIKSKQAKSLNFWLHKKWKRTPADGLDYCLRNGLTRTKLGRLKRFLGFEVIPDPKDVFGPLCDLQKKLREQGFFRPCSKLVGEVAKKLKEKDKEGRGEYFTAFTVNPADYIRLLMKDEWGGEYFSTNVDLSEERVIGQEWVVSIDGSSGSGLADGGGCVSLMMRPLCVPNEALYRVDLSCCLGIANWQENVNTITSLFEAPEIKTGGTLLSTTGIVLQKGPHAGKTVKIEFHGTADQSAELKGKEHAGASCAASCGNCFQNDKEMQTLKRLEKWVPKDANFNLRRPTRQEGGSSASEAELNAEEGDKIPPPCEEEEEAKRKEGEETKKAKIQPLCRHECNCPLEPNEEGKQCGRKVLYEMNSLWRDSILINTDTLISVANPELSKKPTAPKFVWPKKSLQGRTVVKLSLQHKDMFRMCHMTDTKERIMQTSLFRCLHVLCMTTDLDMKGAGNYAAALWQLKDLFLQIHKHMGVKWNGTLHRLEHA
uniref:Uncharacterized protein n=1 Tax=Chromera velia CCMP2878 TaxID=1169474 RepID=A0A0G4IFA4_9ALVE|eukprot:Cvel_13851.t1-p1 / transcript=Cvel_13851.t1 / gene=Cvel_13851 / organism=Chromera_velia_CCMP2878 / gene_product=hypothetical protein / transcript_product=hypothetical protein / location=Cvel_scaffold962:38766-41486(-) / protein_length=678 / sequence_SO=supercontig / SO=protein_coding / is_pseudo=false